MAELARIRKERAEEAARKAAEEAATAQAQAQAEVATGNPLLNQAVDFQVHLALCSRLATLRGGMLQCMTCALSVGCLQSRPESAWLLENRALSRGHCHVQQHACADMVAYMQHARRNGSIQSSHLICFLCIG